MNTETHKFLRGVQWLCCEIWNIEKAKVDCIWLCNLEGEKVRRYNDISCQVLD